MMSKDLVGLRVRLPKDAKEFLRQEAEHNKSSQNSEIVRAVRAAMKAKGPVATAIAPDLNTNNP